jgi:hypothetical protein
MGHSTLAEALLAAQAKAPKGNEHTVNKAKQLHEQHMNRVNAIQPKVQIKQVKAPKPPKGDAWTEALRRLGFTNTNNQEEM